MLALLPVLSLLAAVRAQGASEAAANDIALVEARFEGAQLVPQFLPTFNPEATLDVNFGTTSVTTGETLEQTAVSEAPELSIVPAADATRFTDSALYTVIMADADVPGTDLASTPQTRHWLVNTVSLSSSAEEGPYPLNFTGSTAITDYAGPGPAEGSGPHRYVVLVYSQPGAFTPPADLSEAGTPLGTFQVQEYVNSTGLGALVAANYFTVQNGEATGSIPETTSVDPATVSAASTSAPSTITSGASQTGSMSSSMSGSMSGGSASSASSGAASETPNAGNKVAIGKGMITGAVGVVGALFGAALAL